MAIRSFRLIAAIVASALSVCLPAIPQAQLPDPVATFSILGYDPETGEVGGAVQSRVFAVGNGVLWAEAEPLVARLAETGQTMGGCGNAEEAAAKINADVVSSDQVRVRIRIMKLS